MDSTLLLLQFTSQNIALFCCALFAGAATYVSLVEHPAMTEGGAKLASTYLLTSHPRPVVFQTSFGDIGSLTGILAGLAGGFFLGAGGGGGARGSNSASGIRRHAVVPTCSRHGSAIRSQERGPDIRKADETARRAQLF